MNAEGSWFLSLCQNTSRTVGTSCVWISVLAEGNHGCCHPTASGFRGVLRQLQTQTANPDQTEHAALCQPGPSPPQGWQKVNSTARAVTRPPTPQPQQPSTPHTAAASQPQAAVPVAEEGRGETRLPCPGGARGLLTPPPAPTQPLRPRDHHRRTRFTGPPRPEGRTG